MSAILSLIRQYVERQQLVLQIMQELRPDLLILGDRATSNKPIEEFLRELDQVQEQVSNVPQSGYWGQDNQWEYFFHGGGCRLVHTLTNEPIDWNASELQRFDKYALLTYVEWVLQHEPTIKAAVSLKPTLHQEEGSHKDFVFEILDRLCETGYLSHTVSENTYTFLHP